ncbi:MAG TPA: phosphatase PAP2 family protein [Candidatus Kryptonia bacterium]
MQNLDYDTQGGLKTVAVLGSGFLFLLTVLALLAGTRIENHDALLHKLLAADALCICSYWMLSRLPEKYSITPLIVATIGLYGFAYQMVGEMQHIFFRGWLDSSLAAFERSLMGDEPSVYLQKFMSPALTEGLMFAYVIYGLLIFTTAFACYMKSGRPAALDYLVAISLANILCDIGFVTFPVAGPLRFDPNQYSVPLQGGFFTACGEWVRVNLHLPGESLPSAHCAVAAAMMMLSFKYNKKYFFLVAPILLAVFPATVYCRYHYAADMLTGIIVGIVAVYLSPVVATAVKRIFAFEFKDSTYKETLGET